MIERENRQVGQYKMYLRRGLMQMICRGIFFIVFLGVIEGQVVALDTPTSGINRNKGEASMSSVKSIAPSTLDSYQSVKGVVHLEHWVTPRGVKVYFVHVPTLPMVDIQLVFDAGAARNGTQGGLAYMTNVLLAEGSKQRSADQVAEIFDKVGAQYHADSRRDMSLLHLRTVSFPAELKTAVDNLAHILAHPAFPEEGLQREKQIALTALQHQAQVPQKVAHRQFYSLLYPDQPYAQSVLGDEASIRSLSPSMLEAFHKQYYVAKNVVVTIVGDVTASSANEIAHTLTQDLPEGEAAPALPPVKPLAKKIERQIDFPSNQTHILMGAPVLKQKDPDYYALYVGNHILGGNSSVNRIFDIIRNQHGLAYSASSYFLPMREKGPFVMGCQTRNEQAQKSLQLLEQVLEAFVEKGPSQDELKAAKLNLLGGYYLQFDSNAAICQQVSSLGFYAFPLEHFNQFKSAVEKLTTEDIKKAFQRHFTPAHYAIVMVGGAGAVTDAQE